MFVPVLLVFQLGDEHKDDLGEGAYALVITRLRSRGQTGCSRRRRLLSGRGV